MKSSITMCTARPSSHTSLIATILKGGGERLAVVGARSCRPAPTHLRATIDLLTPIQRQGEGGIGWPNLRCRCSQLEEFCRRAATKLKGRGDAGGGARRCRRAAPQSPHAVTVFLAPSSRSSAPSSDDEEEMAARRRVEGEGSR
uniref:Uncharacterized protein n=1 Tax=Oryza nivara TaxID=4536 RepID=A0A0E0H2U6_ORYNI